MRRTPKRGKWLYKPFMISITDATLTDIRNWKCSLERAALTSAHARHWFNPSALLRS